MESVWKVSLVAAALAVVASLALGSAPAQAHSGAGGVWALKCGTWKADDHWTGNQAGLDSAIAWCDSCGFVQIGPGMEAVTPTYSVPGVMVARMDSTGFSVLRGVSNLGDGLIVGGGGKMYNFLNAEASLTFDLTSVSSQDRYITVDGAEVGAKVLLGLPALDPDVVYEAVVETAGVVTVHAVRTCDSTPNPGTGIYKVLVIQ